MIHPSRRSLQLAGGGLLLALLPILLNPDLWSLWASFWIVFVLVHGADLILAPHPSSWDVRLKLPPVLVVGRDHRLEIHIEIPRPANLGFDLGLDMIGTLRSIPDRRARLVNGRTKVIQEVHPTRRGRAGVERVWLRYTGPLGLMRQVCIIRTVEEAPVVPDINPVKGLAFQFTDQRRHLAGLKIDRYLGEGSEFESLREYQPGHDHRALDWKSSARHTRLLVRQFRAERNHQIIVAVDCGHLMAEPIAGLSRLDHAIHAALMFTYMSLKSGDRVGLYSFDDAPRVFVKPRGGVRSFPSLMAHTGDIAYSTGETNFTLGLTNLATKLNRRSLIVVLTDFVDSVTAELMLENMYRLSRRHLMLFVSIRDPMLTRFTLAAPGSVELMNRAVVAHGLQREREIVFRRLRRRGVLLVDARPDSVGIKLVNRYLEIKRRELI